MSKKKRPLMYSENKSILPYPSEVASFKITPIDVEGWKKSNVQKVEKLFLKKKEEIEKTIEDFIESYKWNKIVYEAKYNFEPIVGESYFLYKGDSYFYLSLLSPKELGNIDKYIGEFKLNSQFEWIKQ